MGFLERTGREAGFTIVELLVAMVLLVVGVLGTVALIDGANASTRTVKARVGATNLARELVEASRSLDYHRLTDALITTDLLARTGLADTGAASGWQVRRPGTGGIEYTITLSACAFDDETDKAGTHDAGTSFCSNSATTPTGDENPDDYRRVTFTASWREGASTRNVSQTAILTNPSGGLGPTISSFTGSTSTLCPDNTSVKLNIQTAAAQTVRWSADDGTLGGDATGGPTAWTACWPIGTPGTFSCTQAAPWHLDGSYLLQALALSARGITGDLKTLNVLLDRSPPAPPCGLEGGRNNLIVDLQWEPNDERDITGYRVFRVKGVLSGNLITNLLTGLSTILNPTYEAGDTEVCALTTKTSCYDSNPLNAVLNPSIQYYVRAYDATSSTKSATLTITSLTNLPPTPPLLVVASLLSSKPHLAWGPATDTDSSFPIKFYRIYKGGITPSHRYDVTSENSFSYTDKGATSLSDLYWVTAVDNEFRESLPVGPVSVP
jgi:Tfp pilus assembly protein PilV